MPREDLPKESSKKQAGESEEWDSHYGDIWHVGDKVKDKETGKIGIIKSINGKEVEIEEVDLKKQAVLNWEFSPVIWQEKFGSPNRSFPYESWDSPEASYEIANTAKFFDRFSGNIKVYREIGIPVSPETFLKNFSEGKVGKYSGIGLWWSWNRNQAAAYDKPVSYSHTILLEGVAQKNDIDWDETIYMYLQLPEEQGIKLMSGVSVTVNRILVNGEFGRKVLIQDINWEITA